MALIAAAIGFLGVFIAFAGLLMALWSREESEVDAIAQRIGPAPLRPARIVRQHDDLLGDSLGRFGSRLGTLLKRAGTNKTQTRVVFEMVLASLAGLLVGSLTNSELAGWAGPLAGLLPLLLLVRMARRRERAILEALPGALDLIVRALQAGRGLSDALPETGRAAQCPLGASRRLISERHRLGMPMADCLEELAQRNPGLEDIGLLVGAMSLQRETGGNLVETLHNVGETVRERIVFEQRVKAMTSEMRMSALILGSLPMVAAGGILAFSPDYLQPFREPGMGQGLVAAAVALIVVGNIVMRRIGSVEA